MGTCTRLEYAKFRIKKENIPKAFAAMRAFVDADLAQCVKNKWRAPTCPTPDKVLVATTLAEQVRPWSWVLDADGDGNVTAIRFAGEKEGAEDDLFQVLGPFVEAGSVVEMRNENGWRSLWQFDGKECRKS